MTLVVRRILVTGAIIALVGLAAIGVARTIAPAQPGPFPAAAAAVAAESDSATSTDLAIGLDAILAAETAPATAGKANARGELRRLAAWRRLVHATVIVDLKDGGLTTVQLDHGTISAVSATSLTIQEAGGSTVTVALGDETRVRRDGAKAAIAALKAGDEIFVMSKVEAAATSAYLVVVPRG